MACRFGIERKRDALVATERVKVHLGVALELCTVFVIQMDLLVVRQCRGIVRHLLDDGVLGLIDPVQDVHRFGIMRDEPINDAQGNAVLAAHNLVQDVTMSCMFLEIIRQ